MKVLPLFLVAVVLACCSCGGGPGPVSTTTSSAQQPQAQPPIGVSPASVSVEVNGTAQFTANVSGVIWQVGGVAGGTNALGTISSDGLYTAPAIVPSTANVTVRAVSAAQSGTATVTLSGPPDPMHDQQTFPIKLGTSGGNVNTYTTSGGTTQCCSGTLGALVSRGGQQYILSNNHVLARLGSAVAGEVIAHPGLVDNNCMPAQGVGVFTQTAPLQTSNVDAAIAQVQSSAVDPSGAILALGSSLMQPAPPASTIRPPAVAMNVAKTGRTSGLTCSSIEAVDTTMQVSYSAPCMPGSTTVTFTGQIAISGSTFSSAGDSGSLVVDSDTAQAVGLLFAGTGTVTAANPIGSVLSALKDPGTGVAPIMVGGAQHAVGCPAATPAAAASVSAIVAPQELARATAAKSRFEVQLLSDPSVISVSTAASNDDPGQAAVVVYVDRSLAHRAIPATLAGVRTRVVAGSRTEPLADALARQQQPAVSRDEMNAVSAVKERHVAELFADPRVYGMGVGASADDPSSAALVVYADTATAPGHVPAAIEGVRTRVIRTAPFRAFDWGEREPARSCTASRPQQK